VEKEGKRLVLESRVLPDGVSINEFEIDRIISGYGFRYNSIISLKRNPWIPGSEKKFFPDVVAAYLRVRSRL